MPNESANELLRLDQVDQLDAQVMETRVVFVQVGLNDVDKVLSKESNIKVPSSDAFCAPICDSVCYF